MTKIQLYTDNLTILIFFNDTKLSLTPLNRRYSIYLYCILPMPWNNPDKAIRKIV